MRCDNFGCGMVIDYFCRFRHLQGQSPGVDTEYIFTSLHLPG